MFANCSMAPGMDFGFPDVCMTPFFPAPIPIPYPNFAMKVTALPPTTSIKHLINFMPSHNMSTTIPLTIGDTPGVLLGVASGTVMGPARHIRCSTTVITGGTPATRMLDNTLHNSTNVPTGMTLVPGQFKVLYLS
ncbi:conserved hypothetical protein [Desulfamplus magnetovallimortis]|uniref:Uncharacterized protein n=1 Tax=Desulfamplus magnetovallimortis TaxID=1246637 RepID=L0R450_9BACT|nr:DUF4150 domain-containing protein [Desulfamplus magnetovallimortis]CCO06833.1 conserved hypothetical protein [Desulfamplus magnetovallimortis BW-1]SLM32884.1 conserved hypothetical protein [Desulfamplus magnetovallimortis]